MECEFLVVAVRAAGQRRRLPLCLSIAPARPGSRAKDEMAGRVQETSPVFLLAK